MSVSLYAVNKQANPERGVRLAATIEAEFAHPCFCNWANPRARSILALLGFTEIEWGEISILQAQAAIVRARAALARGEGVTWGESIQYGAPRAHANGVVDLHPVRVVSGGCDRSYLRHEIERVACFVAHVAQKGATHVRWY